MSAIINTIDTLPEIDLTGYTRSPVGLTPYDYNHGIIADHTILTGETGTHYAIGSEIGKINDRLGAIEGRLSILMSPNEEDLEKYESLRNAYNEYKTIEKLLGITKD